MRASPHARIVAVAAAAILAVVLGAAGAVALGSSNVPPGWLVPSAPERMQLAVQAPSVGSTLAGFPVKVLLKPDTFDYTHADAQHLVFTAGDDATPLPYEVEQWDRDGTSTVWVKVPAVSATAADVDVYFGDGAPANSTAATDVWDSRYLAVNHFDAASTTLKDSTANGFDGTLEGTDAATAGPGQDGELGGLAVALNGTDGDVDFGTSMGSSVSDYTYSTTVDVTPAMIADTNYHQVGGRDQFTGSHPGEQYSMLIYRGHAYASQYPAKNTSNTDAAAVVTAGWHTFTVSYDHATRTLRLYIDGAQAETLTGVPELPTSDPLLHFLLGTYTPDSGRTTNTAFTYDEFRLSDTSRGADWIKADHLSQTGQLVTASHYQTQDDVTGTDPTDPPDTTPRGPPAGWQVPAAERRLQVAVGAPGIGSAVTNFPVLVEFDTSNFDYGSAAPDHLVFLAEGDDTPLPYEIERWDTHGTSSAWVKVPSVGSTASTVNLYYDGAPLNTTDATDVWEADYATVNHFASDEGTLDDSTQNGWRGTAATGAGQYQQETGSRTYGFRLNGTDGDIDFGTSIGAGLAHYTFSATVDVTPAMVADSDYHQIGGRDQYSGVHPGEQFSMLIKSGHAYASLYTGTANVATSQADSDSAVTAGWHTFTQTYDGTALRLYIDGRLAETAPTTAAVNQADLIHFLLGTYTANDGTTTFTPFAFDEMRLSDQARSADWIKAEYLAQSDQLATAATTSQTQNGNVLLSVTEPLDGTGVGSSMTLRGTVDQPATVTYKLEAGDEVSLGAVTGSFSAAISGLANGEHHLTVTATGDGAGNTTTRTIDFTADAVAPSILFNTPQAGQSFGPHQPFRLDVATSDPSGIASTTLKIDGRTYADGDTIGADDLTPGAHTLVVTAADRLDNSTTRQISFATGSDASFSAVTPADGAKGVDPAHTTLGVTATNVLGGNFDLVFKRGYVADASGGGIAGVAQGSSTTAQPGRVGGDAVADSSGIDARDDRSLVTDSTDAYPYQRFDVKVPASLGSSRFTPKWSGRVPAGDRAALSVWNKTTSSWQLVDAATSDGDAIALSGDAAVADTVTDGTAELLVQDAPARAFADNADVLKTAWVTDTQFYSESNPLTFHAETQWVLDHNSAAAPADKISYGFLTGDIVNSAGQARQWTNASPALQRWDDAGFPYGIVEGNHDLTVCNYTSANGCGPSDSQNSQLPAYGTYQRVFGADRYSANPWYGGSQFDNAQHYDIVSTPKADFLFLYLDLYLTPDEITWADQVIRSHPNANVVLATHEYTEQNGRYVTEQPLAGVGIGQRIYNELAAPNKNVVAVFSGHVWPSEHWQAKDLGNGRVLDEILYDPQSQPNQGNGWMSTVDFDTAHQTITKREFSVTNPGLGNNYMGNEGQANFTIPMTVTAPDRVLSTDVVSATAFGTDAIGEAHGVASGAPATVAVPPSMLRVGETFAWYVTATAGDGTATTSPLYTLTPSAAFDSTVAQISGTPKVGQTLTADTSGFSPQADAYTYQWKADGTAIDGETAAKLRLTAGMVGRGITVSVHATKADYGDADAQSSAVTVVNGDFTPGDVSIDGDARAGRTVTAHLGTWDPQPAPADVHYQWLLDGRAIQGATSASYAIPVEQAGRALSVQVTIDDADYDGLQTVSAGVTIGRAELSAGTVPTIGGTAKVGKTVTVDPGSTTPADDGHPSYQWLLGGQPIAGQTQPTYDVKPADATAALSVRVTHHKTGYADLVVDSGAVTVAKGQFAAGSPTISGSVKVGEPVSAVAGVWSPSPASVTYQWLLDGQPLAGATSATYTVTANDGGHRLSVAVAVHAPGYEDGSATSGEQSVAAGQLMATTDPTMRGTFQVGATIDATPGTWSHEAHTTGYQWLLDGQPIAGATAASYTLPATAAGHWLSVQVSAEATGYAAATATSQSMSIADAPAQRGPTPPSGDPTPPSARDPARPAQKSLAHPRSLKVSGTKRVGATLKVNVAKGKWPAHTTLHYQWYAAGKKIKGATKSTYKVAARYRGKKLTVKVTGSRKGYRSVTVTVAAGKVAASAKAAARTRKAVAK